MDRNLLDLYDDGGRTLLKAIDGLDEADLVAFPVPGTWSIKQLVVHLADCDMLFSDRIKRVLAEDRPSLLAIDPDAWVANLHYQLQSAFDMATLLDLNRRTTSAALRLLPDEAFARVGVHNQRGEMTVEAIIQYAVNHVDHHLKFLYAKREKLGKLMW
jgi:uncharacterized damage-inducible protein DinB